MAMKRVRLSLLIAGLCVIIILNMAQRLYSERHDNGADIVLAVQRLTHVPLQVGDWTAHTMPMEAAVINKARLAGCWMRQYKHAATHQEVSVVLMCGAAGPTSVHTPEWCYGGAGYDLTAEPVRCTILQDGSSPDDFWTARFTIPESAHKDSLRMFWAWNATGSWEAPRYPRLTYTPFPVLYKLYVASVSPTATEDDKASCSEFIQMLLPQLRAILFPSH